jgi:hypothetical protein
VLETPFIVRYRSRNGDVEILAVFHGARRWPDGFGRAAEIMAAAHSWGRARPLRRFQIINQSTSLCAQAASGQVSCLGPRKPGNWLAEANF